MCGDPSRTVALWIPGLLYVRKLKGMKRKISCLVARRKLTYCGRLRNTTKNNKAAINASFEKQIKKKGDALLDDNNKIQFIK